MVESAPVSQAPVISNPLMETRLASTAPAGFLVETHYRPIDSKTIPWNLVFVGKEFLEEATHARRS